MSIELQLIESSKIENFKIEILTKVSESMRMFTLHEAIKYKISFGQYDEDKVISKMYDQRDIRAIVRNITKSIQL